MSTANNTKENSEAAIDKILSSQADNMSAWEQPIRVKDDFLRAPLTLSKGKIFALLEKKQTRIRGFGVMKLGVFGSFVRNEQNRDSDIDLLVEFDQGRKTFDGFIQLAFFWEELFAKRVELFTAEGLSPYIRPHVLEEVEYVAFTA